MSEHASDEITNFRSDVVFGGLDRLSLRLSLIRFDRIDVMLDPIA
jgi:hypothetical protein